MYTFVLPDGTQLQNKTISSTGTYLPRIGETVDLSSWDDELRISHFYIVTEVRHVLWPPDEKNMVYNYDLLIYLTEKDQASKV